MTRLNTSQGLPTHPTHALGQGEIRLARNSSQAEVVYPIAQSLGPDLITNGGFDSDTSWTKGTGWTISGGAADSAGGAGAILFQGVASTVGQFIEHRMTVTAYTSGSAGQRVGAANVVFRSGAGERVALLRRPDTNLNDGAVSNLFVGSIDNLSEKVLTLNPQITAPSADMRLDIRYPLLASPVAGAQTWLLPRISDFASGYYWLVLLEFTGSQWNITLYSVAAHVRTATAAAATNIGATNGVRINMLGNSISLFTTADDFGSVTQRGSTISNALYNTAVGVNAIFTSDFSAPVTITYTPASP